MLKDIFKFSVALFVSVLGFNSVQAAPEVFIDPVALDYGDVVLDAGTRQTIRVENRGTEPLAINIAIVNPSLDKVTEFAFTSNFMVCRTGSACSARLLPGALEWIDVTYLPSYLGAAQQYIEVSSNDPVTPFFNIPLTGNGIYAEVGCGLIVTHDYAPVTDLDFGVVEIPGEVVKTLRLYNNGSTDCQISDVAVTGSAAFALDGDGNLATVDPVLNSGPITVSPSSRRNAFEMHVIYGVNAVSNDVGLIEINSDDNDQPVYPVNLSGSAVEPAVQYGALRVVPPATLDAWIAFEGESITIEVERVNGSIGAVSVDYNTRDWLATAGLDYVAASGTLTWLDGDIAPKSITITTLSDVVAENTEDFYVELTNPTGGAVIHDDYYIWGAPVLQIVDPLMPDTITFPVTFYIVNESDGFVDVTVRREGNGAGVVSYSYTTTDGTAVGDVDYATTTGQIVWLDGELGDKIITVPIYADQVVELGETFFIDGSSLDPLTAQTDASRPVIEIKDSTATDTVSFQSASYSVSESDGSVAVTLTRTGNGVGDFYLSYATFDGTALGGSDYTSLQNGFWWFSGDLEPKTITIPVSSDSLLENDEQFHLHVMVGLGDVVLTGPDTATITITDTTVNEAPVVDTGGPYSGYIGSTITFDGSASYDPNLDSMTYFWDFGDGATASGAVVLHTYSPKRDATYTVTLTVTDQRGASSTATTTVDVTKPPKNGGNGGGGGKK